MSQESILIVSDEQESRALLAQALSSHDGAVLVAEGAARAIVALDEHQVAVVILDWPLAETQDEGQDGVGALARHIRQSQPEASIIALLGRDDVALMDLASLDVDDCLVKPPLPDLVRLAVARALELCRLKREVEQLLNLAGAHRADELVLLNEVGQAMVATLDFDEVLWLLLQAVAKTVRVDECVVALWDETTQCYVPRARFAGGQMLVADLSNGDTTILEASLPPVRVRLEGHDRVLGLLALNRRSGESELNTQDLQLAQALSNQAASALENAWLYAELKQSAEELERSQHRLIQSGKLAATGRLAASIAHEINNPLQAIKNCLELIFDEAEAGEPLDRVYLNVAMNELERIRVIIQQMLDLYRSEQGQMAPVDLNAAVEGVLALMRKQLESHHIGVETHLDSARPHVIGRGDQVRQVFINLILNAIEAMPEGGQLTLTTHQENDGVVAVQVADTGVGIAPEDLARIADPFFTTKPKGVGLGLFICHEIIERHQGTLDLSSQVGHGSTFTIRLPASEGA